MHFLRIPNDEIWEWPYFLHGCSAYIYYKIPYNTINYQMMTKFAAWGPACIIKFHSLSAAAIKWSIASKIWRYNNWMNSEFSALDNLVRFHGCITFIVDKMNVKYSRISSCLITTWQNSFCSKDLIQFEPHSPNLWFIAVSISFLLIHPLWNIPSTGNNSLEGSSNIWWDTKLYKNVAVIQINQ